MVDNKGKPKRKWLDELVNDIKYLIKQKKEIIIVSPGAIALGAKYLNLRKDELKLDNAHIVGASMGGMIAQTIASSYPERTKSLVSIMSTSGARHLPEMSDSNQSNFRNVGELDIEQVHAFGFYPEAMSRQMTAILKAGDRSEQIKTIAVPTLIQHGIDDALLPVEHGKHTAELIQGSEIVIYDGMGHNLPDEVVPTVLSDMLSFFEET